mgnify:CR=1 FL=1
MGKDFDAVAFMRRRREEIGREDEGLSWEERARKTREIVEKDPLGERLRDRQVDPSRHFLSTHSESGPDCSNSSG